MPYIFRPFTLVHVPIGPLVHTPSVLLPIDKVTSVRLTIGHCERTHTIGMITRPLSFVDVAAGKAHGTRSVPLVVTPVSHIDAKSIGIPDLAESVPFVVDERSNVTAAVAVLRDAATVALAGDVSLADVGVVVIVRLRLLLLGGRCSLHRVSCQRLVENVVRHTGKHFQRVLYSHRLNTSILEW